MRTRPSASPTAHLDHGLYVPSTWPGVRAPHVWLKDGKSTLDLFGKGFTLLDLTEQRPDTAPFAAAAAKTGVPLTVVALKESNVKQAYERNLVLIRPDGHVAWRGDSVPENPANIINCARGAE